MLLFGGLEVGNFFESFLKRLLEVAHLLRRIVVFLVAGFAGSVSVSVSRLCGVVRIFFAIAREADREADREAKDEKLKILSE